MWQAVRQGRTGIKFKRCGYDDPGILISRGQIHDTGGEMDLVVLGRLGGIAIIAQRPFDRRLQVGGDLFFRAPQHRGVIVRDIDTVERQSSAKILFRIGKTVTAADSQEIERGSWLLRDICAA